MKITKRHTGGLRRPRRASGFTLVEAMIGMTIAIVVMTAVATLQLISARTVKDMYAETRTRSQRMRTLDLIRYKLISAQKIFNEDDVPEIGGHKLIRSPYYPSATEVQWLDPTKGLEGVYSRIYLKLNPDYDATSDLPANHTLVYEEDMFGIDGDSPGPLVIGRHIESIEFEDGLSNVGVTLVTKAVVANRYKDNPDSLTFDKQEATTLIRLVNRLPDDTNTF